MLTPLLVALAIASGTAASAPLDSFQQNRLAALLIWTDAYRDCYEPALYSMDVDRRFTADCIETALQHAAAHGSRDERAALDALIGETPRLIGVLNAPPAAKAVPRTARSAAAAPRVQD